MEGFSVYTKGVKQHNNNTLLVFRVCIVVRLGRHHVQRLNFVLNLDLDSLRCFARRSSKIYSLLLSLIFIDLVFVATSIVLLSLPQ